MRYQRPAFCPLKFGKSHRHEYPPQQIIVHAATTEKGGQWGNYGTRKGPCGRNDNQTVQLTRQHVTAALDKHGTDHGGEVGERYTRVIMHFE
jgi:hypothetical protein